MKTIKYNLWVYIEKVIIIGEDVDYEDVNVLPVKVGIEKTLNQAIDLTNQLSKEFESINNLK
tara:strand:+ start:6293 stop:6478 length:186 start_codon:yes stop_codon:yes gene_type:complete